MSEGSSLSVEKPDNVLISPNGVFSAGFYSVGFNAYCFAIWYREPLYDGSHTTVWMANRDQPINGRLSKFTLLKNGNLILTDAGQLNVWATNTESISSVQLLLNDIGNLFLLTSEGLILWQSFQSPTDTLLPYQPLTRNTKLVSSRSQTNYSSGFYKLFFDDENVLSLAYDGPEASSIYWPDPWLKSWEAGRSSYNNSRIAVFNSSGHFKSTDDFQFTAADSGIGIQRRLTMDHDGNIRMYSLDEKNKIWNVTWQAKSQPCKIHGICGPNSLCTYVPHEKSGRRCSCAPGYKIKNETNQSLGCEPDFSLSCNESEIGFLHLPHVEFYGYDDNKICENYTYKSCDEFTVWRSDGVTLEEVAVKGTLSRLIRRRCRDVVFSWTGWYWLCEHSSIIEPQTENMFPRFMKWDIGKLLIKGQGVDLSGPVKFQVKVDRLRSFEYEREMMGADVVEFGDVKASVVGIFGGDDRSWKNVELMIHTCAICRKDDWILDLMMS
ncbi:putative receptor protein kinase ZmPK1 [Camellia lanceoleosa]|uniref:Receptor protein kinase ZmPK1 n=1 Tax=Camellia lanceoleosa TaxID=1840588 RepID=A0ACC0FFV1_9ERIC|nr:putative receptor protein kinase ZmPK1 [Camellia lanceoleosa]